MFVKFYFSIDYKLVFYFKYFTDMLSIMIILFGMSNIASV